MALSEETFGGPIYVTENGYPIDDERPARGKVHDDARIGYMRAHLEAILEARANGAAVRGYFAWTLIDNWEWTFGWRPRFGLVHLDPVTQARTPKASYDWYASVARSP